MKSSIIILWVIPKALHVHGVAGPNLNTYTYWEGIVIKVSGGGLQNSTVIFNLYIPPKPGNDILKEVIEELTSRMYRKTQR